MSTVSLQAAPRTETGSAPAGRLRRSGWVPGVLYGLAKENVVLQVPEKQLDELMRSGHAQGLIHLSMEGKTVPAMLKDFQRNPVTRRVLSVDFLRVDPKVKIHTRVPVRLAGEPEGLPEGATVERVLNEIEIEALPGQVPDEIQVDIRELKVGHPLTVGDLPATREYAYVTLSDEAVAIIIAASRVVEEVPEVEEVAEAPAPEKVEGKEDK